MKPNVIMASEAAEIWGCSTQAVYNAMANGRLTEVRMGRLRLILKDKKFREFEVRQFGGRLHAKYVNKGRK